MPIDKKDPDSPPVGSLTRERKALPADPNFTGSFPDTNAKLGQDDVEMLRKRLKDSFASTKSMVFDPSKI